MGKPRSVVILILLALGAAGGLLESGDSAYLSSLLQPATPTSDNNANADDLLRQAFEQRRGDVQIEVSGSVSKVLRDDNHGSRHQRFILQLDSGQTVLVAHNIDLAPRVENLKAGDRLSVYGEYEWNERGGVIHWTHHDPAGRHADGWIEHNGQRYQ